MKEHCRTEPVLQAKNKGIVEGTRPEAGARIESKRVKHTTTGKVPTWVLGPCTYDRKCSRSSLFSTFAMLATAENYLIFISCLYYGIGTYNQ